MITEFIDDHEEAHAIPAGIAFGFAIVSTGELQKAAIVTGLFQQVFERKKRPEAREKQHLGNDIRREPHYFFAGFAIGVVLGVMARTVNGLSPFPPLPF